MCDPLVLLTLQMLIPRMHTADDYAIHLWKSHRHDGISPNLLENSLVTQILPTFLSQKIEVILTNEFIALPYTRTDKRNIIS